MKASGCSREFLFQLNVLAEKNTRSVWTYVCDKTCNKCLNLGELGRLRNESNSGLEYVTFYTGNPTNKEELNSFKTNIAT
jgi:hypothetical protein